MKRAKLPQWPVCGDKFNKLFGVTDEDWSRTRVRKVNQEGERADELWLIYPDSLPDPEQVFQDREALEAKPPESTPLASAGLLQKLDRGLALPAEAQPLLAEIVRRLGGAPRE